MRYRCSIHVQDIELLHNYKMLRRLFTRFNGNSADERLRSAAANLRNMVEARALADGNYHQYERTSEYTDPHHLHSTPSREDLRQTEPDRHFMECEHCGQIYCTPAQPGPLSIFDTVSEVDTQPSGMNASETIRFQTCHYCHNQIRPKPVLSGSENSSATSEYQDAAEQLLSMSSLSYASKDTRQYVAGAANAVPNNSLQIMPNVQLSLDFELDYNGSLRQVLANEPKGAQMLNIRVSVLPPNSTANSTPRNKPNHKSTQTQSHANFLAYGQQSFIRRQAKADPQSSRTSRLDLVWYNVSRQQERLQKSINDMTDALLDMVVLCRDSNAAIVVKPFWGHGTFKRTSDFYQFGDASSVNVLLATVDRGSGGVADEFAAALSLVRCVLNRRPDLQSVFRVEFRSELLSTDDNVNRVIQEMCDVFGETIICDASSRELL